MTSRRTSRHPTDSGSTGHQVQIRRDLPQRADGPRRVRLQPANSLSRPADAGRLPPDDQTRRAPRRPSPTRPCRPDVRQQVAPMPMRRRKRRRSGSPAAQAGRPGRSASSAPPRTDRPGSAAAPRRAGRPPAPTPGRRGGPPRPAQPPPRRDRRPPRAGGGTAPGRPSPGGTTVPSWSASACMPVTRSSTPASCARAVQDGQGVHRGVDDGDRATADGQRNRPGAAAAADVDHPRRPAHPTDEAASASVDRIAADRPALFDHRTPPAGRCRRRRDADADRRPRSTAPGRRVIDRRHRRAL